jgi:PAS domain S-box-containing protein
MTPELNQAKAEIIKLKEVPEARVEEVEERTRELASINEALKKEIIERDQAEKASARLAAIVESSDDAIIGKDLNGIITSWNQGAERIFGYTASEMIGFSILRLIPAGRHHEEIQILEKLKRGESLRHFETVRQTKDGRLIDISVTASPITDSAGKVIGVSKVARDITESRQAEKNLRDSREQMRALLARLESLREEERIRISREIHDELGQRLTVLRMRLQLMERQFEEMEGSPEFNTLLDRIVEMSELVDEIVRVVQEVAAQLRPGVLDKLGLGSALQYESRRFLERTGISWEVRLPETEPVVSTEVTTALFRIFQECLANIARHAHATKVETALNLEEGWVTLRVQDNGRGITEAEMADPASLGLLGMKERTALLGGKIAFQRDTEGGTIVTVRIPESRTPVPSKEPV